MHVFRDHLTSECFEGTCLTLLLKRIFCTSSLISNPSDTARLTTKAERKACWNDAQVLVTTILRDWMNKNPGIEVPEDVLAECEDAIVNKLPIMHTGNEETRRHEVAGFVRHSHKLLRCTERPPQKIRSDEEWLRLFPRYPIDENGYLRCLQTCDVEGIRSSLNTFGLCIVKVMTKADCQASVDAMFEEINFLRFRKGIDGPLVSPEDPCTWNSTNWPSTKKFLVDDLALHRQAFANRCSERIYEAFVAAFGEKRLHVSIDKWGIARGAKQNPKWAVALKPHWDLNPWQFLRDADNGINSGYQGLVALTDQNVETGCHMSLPGCTHFLRQWTLERMVDAKATTSQSFHADLDDPILRFMQPIPLRKGEMVIWSWGQLHGSSRSQSDRMRLSQYVRMYPAPEALSRFSYESRDRFGCEKTLRRCAKNGTLPQALLEDLRSNPLSSCLLGLQKWPEQED